jgi:hypothetical protein
MITLMLKDGARLGNIDASDLRILLDQLEEEGRDDHDYFMDGTTIGILGEAGASQHLLDLLHTAVGASEGVDIAWREN